MKKSTLIGLLAIIIFAGGAVFVSTLGDDESEDQTITTKVDTLDGSPNKDKSIEVPKEAVTQAEDAISGESDSGPLDSDDADHTSLRNEVPENVPGLILEDIQNNIQENKKTTEALPTAGATGGFRGCVTSFVRNQSSRRGVRPIWQVAHYTVSPNRPGRSDVNGITTFFNNSNSQASSHFVIDREGNCNYIVPIEAKAWTQAAGNPFSISYEIINTGGEKPFMMTAGYAKLRMVMTEVSLRTGIPLRNGTVNQCSTGKSGIVQHKDFGTCGGGHHDIGPFSMTSILSNVASGSSAVSTVNLKILTAGERRNANCLILERRVAARHGGWSKVAPTHRTRADNCKARLNTSKTKIKSLGLTSKNNRANRYITIGLIIKRKGVK